MDVEDNRILDYVYVVRKEEVDDFFQIDNWLWIGLGMLVLSGVIIVTVIAIHKTYRHY